MITLSSASMLRAVIGAYQRLKPKRLGPTVTNQQLRQSRPSSDWRTEDARTVPRARTQSDCFESYVVFIVASLLVVSLGYVRRRRSKHTLLLLDNIGVHKKAEHQTR
eukprot:COSAG02_NODE_2065_length_9961_cov_37.811397_3_plen_107_part_00